MHNNIFYQIIVVALSVIIFSCTDSSKENTIEQFFGEDMLILQASNYPNGYNISILKADNICIAHLKREDDVNQYIILPCLPKSLNSYNDSTGIIRDIQKIVN